MGFYAASLIPPGVVLHRAANALDLPVTLGRSLAAQILGHLGKYVPGKAMVIVLRVNALTNDPTQIAPGSVAVFFETLLMMSVGAAVAGVLAIETSLPPWVRWAILGIAVTASVAVSPPVMRRVLRRLARGRGLTHVPVDRVTWRLLGVGVVGQLIAWTLIGGSMTCIACAFGDPGFWTLYRPATVAICLGMVLGFVSLLPGGAGVREWISLLVLTPAVGPAVAILSVVMARLLFIAVEACSATAAWLILRRRSLNQPDGHAAPAD